MRVLSWGIRTAAAAGLLLAAGCSSGSGSNVLAGAGAFSGSGSAGSGGSPGSTASHNGLAGHYYWGTANGKDFLGVYFADGTHAYSGLPSHGLPTCAGTDTGSGTPQGIGAQGCVTYTYDASSGAVTVGDLSGTYSSKGFTLNDLHMAQLTVPSAGSTLSVTLLSVYASGAGNDFSGGFSYLTLADSGQFSTSSGTTVGTLSGDVSALPANQHGTYKIESNGRLELDFADGTTVVRTIGLDQESDHQPALRGAMLDSTFFENKAVVNN